MFRILLDSNRLAERVLAADRAAAAGRELLRRRLLRAPSSATRCRSSTSASPTPSAPRPPSSPAPGSRPAARRCRPASRARRAASPSRRRRATVSATWTAGRRPTWYDAGVPDSDRRATTTSRTSRRRTSPTTPTAAAETSWFGRLRRRLRDMLREAEAERHRRHETAAPAGADGVLSRGCAARSMRWIVERAAEQRLLWHLRTAAVGHARGARRPRRRRRAGDPEARAQARRRPALAVVRRATASGSMVSVALILVPGPNVLGYYFTFTTVGHLLAWRGAAHGLKARRRGRCRRARSSPNCALALVTGSPRARAARARRGRATGTAASGDVLRAAGPSGRVIGSGVTLRELAERLGAALEGDGAIEVTRVAGIEQAGPGDVTFLANAKYAAALAATTRASAVILDPAGAAGAVRGAARSPIPTWPSPAPRRPSRRRARCRRASTPRAVVAADAVLEARASPSGRSW